MSQRAPQLSANRSALYETVDRRQLSVSERSKLDNKLDRVWHRFKNQTRRLSSPITNPYAAAGAIEHIGDQARVLSNVVHKELLQFEVEDARVMPLSVIHELLTLNEQWIDRLENQAWLLENTVNEALAISALLKNPFTTKTGAELRTLAVSLRNQLQHIPDTELVMHEPGLNLSDEMIRHASVAELTIPDVENTAELLSLAVLSTRYATWLLCRSADDSTNIAAVFARAVLIQSEWFQQPELGRVTQPMRQVVSDFGTQNEDRETSIATVAARFAQVIIANAKQHRERNVLPSLKQSYQPLATKFRTLAQSGACDVRLANCLIESLELNVAPNQSQEELERLILFKRLRRHAPERIRKASQPNNRPEQQPVPSPKFLQRLKRQQLAGTQKQSKSSHKRSFRIDRTDES